VLQLTVTQQGWRHDLLQLTVTQQGWRHDLMQLTVTQQHCAVHGGDVHGSKHWHAWQCAVQMHIAKHASG
jgi:hypothetical protein